MCWSWKPLVSLTLWLHTRRLACQKWSREGGRTSRDRYSTCRITSLPSGSGSALGTAITLPASQIFVLWSINLYGCKDYSPTSDNNCLGSPLQNYFLVHFLNKQSSTVLKIESKLLSFTAIILVTTCYWNVITNSWVSPGVRVFIRLVRNPRITASYDTIIASELIWGYVKKLQGVFLSLTIKPYEQFLSCCTRIKTKVCIVLKTQCSWYEVEYFNLNLKTKATVRS